MHDDGLKTPRLIIDGKAINTEYRCHSIEYAKDLANRHWQKALSDYFLDEVKRISDWMGLTINEESNEPIKNNIMEDQEFKVGQKVYDSINFPDEIGEVISIDEATQYPVRVTFTRGDDIDYTKTGQYLRQSRRTLYHKPYSIKLEAEIDIRSALLDKELDNTQIVY